MAERLRGFDSLKQPIFVWSTSSNVTGCLWLFVYLSLVFINDDTRYNPFVGKDFKYECSDETILRHIYFKLREINTITFRGMFTCKEKRRGRKYFYNEKEKFKRR